MKYKPFTKAKLYTRETIYRAFTLSQICLIDWLIDFIDIPRKGLFNDNYKLLNELLYNINNLI